MGIIKRQGLKSSMVNYAGVLLGVIFFNFVFPNILNEEYIGLIGLLRNLTYVIGSIPLLGLGNFLLNYHPTWNDSKITNGFNSLSAFASFMTIVLISIVLIIFKDNIVAAYVKQSSLFIPYYYALIPLIFIYTFNTYSELYSLAHYRITVPAALREIMQRILLILFTFLFVKEFIGEENFVFGIVLSYLIPFLFLITYITKLLHFRLGSVKPFLSQKNIRPQFTYAAFMFLLVVSTTVHNFLDGILLPSYLGLSALGLYMPAQTMGQMIQVPYRSIALISIPVIREAIVANDLRKVKDLNTQAGINLFLIGCFLFVLLVVNSHQVFELLPPRYSIAKNVMYIIALGRLLDMSFGLNSEIINYSKHYKYIIVFSLVMMITTIVGNIILIPMYGLDGAAVSVSLSLIVFNVLKTMFIYRKYGFHCFSFKYITLGIISMLVIAIFIKIPSFQLLQNHMFFNPLINMALRSIIASILFIIPVYYFKISEDFNDLLKLILSGKILSGGHKMTKL